MSNSSHSSGSSGGGYRDRDRDYDHDHDHDHDRDRNSNGSGSSHSHHNNNNNNNNNNHSNSNGRMHQRSPQQISNTFSGGGHYSHQGSSRRYGHNHSSRLSHNSNGSYRQQQQRNHYPYGSSHYNNNHHHHHSNNTHKPHPRFDRDRLDKSPNWSTTIDDENNHSGGNGNSKYFSHSNHNHKSYSSGNKYRSTYNKRRSNDDQYYDEEYNDEEDFGEYDQDGYEDEDQDLDYGRTYGSQFTIDEIAELECAMETAELERAMETKREEYLEVDGRPPPFEYDTNNPPIPLKKEQLNPGDILCVYHPEYCFWYVNYGFHEFSDKTRELILKSLDPRVEEHQRELRIPCSSWPLIYRYTRADKEAQLKKNELEQVTLSAEKQVSRKLEIQKKKLLEIQWDGKDEQIMKNLHLYWIHHKNSFLRCLNLAAKILKIPDTTYADLTVVSGAGIYFRWKEAFDDEYSKMGSVDEEIQLINATSLLQLEQVWTDAWRSQTTDKDDSAKAEYIKGLEERIVESLKKKALVLTHDNNGHFGILCAYKALKKDLIDEMKFLEKPANYVFLLRKFVLDEDASERQNEDHISIVSRKHVVFVKAKETNPHSDLTFEVTEKIRLKAALQTAIQVYYCNEKEISDKNLNGTDGNVMENDNENKEKNENEDVANSIDQTTSQTEEPKKEDAEKASTTEEENNENKEIAAPKIEEDGIEDNDNDNENEENELEAKTFNPEVEGSLGFKRWMECLAPDRVLKNELYMLSLHCLMLFYDARCSLMSYLDKLISYDKNIAGESRTDSNNTNEIKKKLTKVLGNTNNLLKDQTKLIRSHELILSHESTSSQPKTVFDKFDGSFSIFSLPDDITLEQRDEYKEELRTLVEKIADFEPRIVKCYEDIVELLP